MQTTPVIGAAVAQAALREVGAPAGEIGGPSSLLFSYDECSQTSPLVIWRAHCIARLAVGRTTPTFVVWRDRMKRSERHRRIVSYPQFCAWLDSVEVDT